MLLSMNVSPLITLYIPSHNYAHYLEDCLESVRHQLFKEFELFLIDDGSTDNTYQVFDDFKRTNQDINISIIRNDQPLGIQSVANIVLSLSKAKYIIRLDADDTLIDSALLTLVTIAESTEQNHMVFVSGNYLVSDSYGKIIGHQQHLAELPYNKAIYNKPPHGACSLISTRLLKSVGGYSKAFKAQDGWDIWKKVENRCIHRHTNSIIFTYRQHGNSLTNSKSKILDSRRSILSTHSRLNSDNYKPSISFLIAAKSKYGEVDDVPLLRFDNTTLLDNCFNQISGLEFPCKTYFITDSDEVEKHISTHHAYARKLFDDNSKIKSFLSQSTPPIDDYLRILSSVGSTVHNEANSDLVCFLNIHSLRRNHNHLDTAIHQLCGSDADVIFSVENINEMVLKSSSASLDLLYYGRYSSFSDIDTQLMLFNGSFILGWSEFFRRSQLQKARLAGFEMSNYESLRITPSIITALKFFDKNCE